MLSRSTCGRVAAFACLLIGAFASADVVSFSSIPGSVFANDITPDGRYVVGGTIDGRAYRYDTGLSSMTLLPEECWNAVAISDDGNTIVGDIIDERTGAEVAAIWTSTSGIWKSLGYLPNALSCPSRSNAYDVSADGTIVTGLSWDGCSGRAYRWTQATGMVEIQNLANGNNRATAIAGNGSVIGGFAQGASNRTPAFWTPSGAGFLVDPPNGAINGEVYNINENGTLLLGTRENSAVIWTYPDLNVTALGSSLPGWSGIAMGISNDGTVVGFDFLIGNRRAWMHRAGPGPCIDLRTYIEANGGTVPRNVSLEVCQGISADGRTIIGHSFVTGGWLVRIDYTHCLADTNFDNTVNVTDLLAVISGWGACPGSCPPRCAADINMNGQTVGDCQVNVTDLLAVISGWGACPPPVGGCCTGTSCTQISQSACVASGGVYLGNSVPCSPTACVNNDSCANAIDITNKINGSTVQGNNSTATPPTFGAADPELPAGSPTCQWNGQPEAVHSTVWYKFTAPASGSVTISTCNSNSVGFFDSTLALYAGQCGELLQVACSEDDCDATPTAPFYAKIVVNGLNAGQVYRVCVMNAGGWSASIPGPFKLNITSP